MRRVTLSLGNQEGELTAGANPYFAARRELNGARVDNAAQVRLWRITAFLSLGVALTATAGLAVVASENHIVPYVVEVDKLGTPLSVQAAEKAASLDPRIIHAELAEWITNMRTVYLDAAAERAMIEHGYALVAKPSAAYGALNEFFRATSPFERARKESVDVQVRSVLPITGDTWRVEWEETTHGRDGTTARTQQFQGTLTIALNPPQDEATIRLNPVGLYVTAFNWSEKL